MTRRVRQPALLAGLAAAAAGVAIAASGTGDAGAQGAAQLQPQLPDLVEAVPNMISTVSTRTHGHRRFRLIFRSSAENVGDGSKGGGDLIIVGHRPNRRTKTMTADQYVDLFDPATGQIPSQELHPDVGELRYVHSSDHQHWHLMHFERYDLRRLSDGKRVARDRKTGFCLGNRYQVASSSASARAAQSRITFRDFDHDCGKNHARLRKVVEGISTGWGDDYKPLLEGQFVDITKVRSGRYVLVHTANPSHRVVESDYTNNASSVLLRIRRHGTRKPTVKVLRRCHGSATCPAR
jgi:hypothetical protein